MSEKQSIFEIFAEVKRAVGPVGKDSRNATQNFNFRGIDAVVNAVAPALDKHGVITAPQLQKMTYSSVEIGKARTPMAHVQVEVTYNFYGPAGDSFPVTVPGEAMDSGDKATAKAMSVAYRIALLQALNLPTDDADPDSQSYERSEASGWDEGRDWPQDSRPQAERPATRDREWLSAALAKGNGGKLSADECREVWRESAQKIHDGAVTKEDAKRVQDALRARIEELGREARDAA